MSPFYTLGFYTLVFSGGIKWIMFPLNVFNIYPFLTNIPILYSLNTPENQRILGVFKKYKMGILATYELKNSQFSAAFAPGNWISMELMGILARHGLIC